MPWGVSTSQELKKMIRAFPPPPIAIYGTALFRRLGTLTVRRRELQKDVKRSAAAEAAEALMHYLGMPRAAAWSRGARFHGACKGAHFILHTTKDFFHQNCRAWLRNSESLLWNDRLAPWNCGRLNIEQIMHVQHRLFAPSKWRIYGPSLLSLIAPFHLSPLSPTVARSQQQERIPYLISFPTLFLFLLHRNNYP